MAERECLKGWIMAPSPTDGKDVPFFVYVREKDIVWDSDEKAIEMEKVASNGSNVQTCYPSRQIKFEKDKWVITLNQDLSYTATRKVSIYREFNTEDTNSIRGIVNLPLDTLNDNNFTVQCTKMSDVMEVITSNISVLPETDSIVSNIEITIDNNSDDVFVDFDTNERFSNSFICVTVTGKVNS